MLTFVSSNQEKIMFARQGLGKFDVEFEVLSLELQEIQSESIEEIATHKAKDAYAKVGSAVLVNDHGWAFPALNGFPGPYMKYINQWLSSEDLIMLMSKKEDKRAILTEVICYFDGKVSKVFSHEFIGRVLDTPQGHGLPCQEAVTLREDGVSIAYKLNEGSYSVESSVWKQFAMWFQSTEEGSIS